MDGVGWISVKDDRFRQRFKQLLLSVPTRDLAVGWQLAVDLGRPAVPLLWDMVHNESSDVMRRLIVLIAAVLAGGPGEDERLFAWLDQRRPMLEERTMAGLLIALGPRRPNVLPGFLIRCQGPAKTPAPLQTIALRLAAARFPEAATGLTLPLTDDPGLAAAAAFAGMTVPASVAAKLWKRGPEEHATMFWRGALLGAAARFDGQEVSEATLEQAREALLMAGDKLVEVRAAAALLLSRARRLRADGARPDWRLLQSMVFDATGAEALQAWLGPIPQPRDEAPERLAVAYVLARPPGDVLAARSSWSGDARINRHVAVAVAFRLLGQRGPTPVEGGLPGVPEWNFVRWASGGSFDRSAEYDDPVLAASARLLADGRLAAPALRVVLEETLWRWGSHPGRAVVEQERLLVRDLLLAGSDPGGGRYQPHQPPHSRYFASGLDRDHIFFTVAVELFEFLGRPRLPMPPEYALR